MIDMIYPHEVDLSRTCAVCGAVVGHDYELDHQLCPSCQDKTVELFRTAMKQFNVEQIDYLDRLLDGEYLYDFLKGE